MNRQFKSLTDSDDAYLACTSGATIKRLYGRWTGGAVGYLQVHDRRTLPTNQEPLRTFRLAAASPYFFDLSAAPISCVNGVALTFSDDPDNAAAATGAGDFQGALDTQEPEGLTDTGEQVAADAYTLWTDSAAHRIYRITVSAIDAGEPYLQLFRTTTPTALQVPLRVWKASTAGTIDICFGPDGYNPSEAGSLVAHLTMSSSGSGYGAPIAGTPIFRVWYFA